MSEIQGPRAAAINDSRVDVPCAICGPGVAFRVLFPEQISAPDVDFSARKQPTRQHFRICRCSGCGLVFSNPILPFEQIESLYREADFLSEDQLENMASDYVSQIRKVLPLLPATDALLEIACSSGFLLARARDELGFRAIAGVEPSRKAVELAAKDVRPHIVCDIFREGQFETNRFDLICCFQALDHFLDPNDVLRNALRVLKPGGHVLFLNHNIRAMMPRLLGRRCPMYDIEHIYLFDTKTVRRLFAKNGFEPVYAKGVRNAYTLEYAAKMFPFPRAVKESLGRSLEVLRLGQVKLPFPGGNMVCVARKPAEAAVRSLRPAA